MEQIQPEDGNTANIAGDLEESSTVEAQPVEDLIEKPTENQSPLTNDSSPDIKEIENTDSNIISSATQLIQESESIFEELSIQNAPTEQNPSNNEITIKESSNNIENTENIEYENKIDDNSTESIQNDFQQKSDDKINSNEESIEDTILQKELQLEEEFQDKINSIDQKVQTNSPLKNKIIRKEVFIDLDIPKPDFSSTSDDGDEVEVQRPPPVSSDDDAFGPADLQTVLETASLDEFSQEKIPNQSSQRINAPQFIPSSQLDMTKQALKEGNSFLKCILTKLKSINQFLQEKTSKFLT